ncbi:rhamnulokinase [Streptomonospora wellingtoniae]|uniref:Rhamnulokinase family protein n=1 Tax=Streptomonospora wellingtoniae TaxID=3075544 RepID=A0ABU2KWD9_9ACTN|nr:rhamnulokinase family protein [Streptomonospora sp. DSM 45055]MDT0303573.1 rhamnulokinase family protein [Streptomonospora sp. DSM 45055]
MSHSDVFAAVDLGASSGRVVVGRVGTDELALTEVHRFPNRPLRLPSGLHWDIGGLYNGVLDGLRAAAAAGHAPRSVGVDSWAVDYGLLDASGALLGLPHHYRDSRTDHTAHAFVERVGAAELYARNGLQYLPFNTVFQLAAAGGTAQLRSARSLLLIPDLLGYWLTGERGTEVTNASTTGLLDVATRRWSAELAEAAGIDVSLLGELRSPGERIGTLLPGPAEHTGLDARTEVAAVASHDTASAVAAVPARTERFGYVSCGTWSLAGLELDAPVTTEAARAANFTNELGVEGTTRFLRNIMGLWLAQECLRDWGLDESAIPGLLNEAASAPAFAALIDAGDPRYLAPGGMPARIADHLRQTGQPVPGDRGGLLRCVLESLALAHRDALRRACTLADQDMEVVHLVGGGARNELLCQWTADALGLPVEAGPVEATAIGNLVVQARAALPGASHADLRRLVYAAERPRRYEPTGTAAWDAAAARMGLE